mmetsp:Transcript_27843/g.43208  ORF Transcript_27843/g.43208 Transcript_27843/m.43208 type:complete len:367 (+) Transcript_27843:196-1296(+)
MKMNSMATALALNLSIMRVAVAFSGKHHRRSVVGRGIMQRFVSSNNQKSYIESSSTVETVHVQEEDKDLNWETFEFSDNPKKDKRFSMGGKQSQHDNLDATAEASEDRIAAARLDEMNAAFRELEPALVEEATEVIKQYINPARMERVNGVLSQRTKRSRFLFENPANPSNVFACLRTIDSFGFQYVDIIVDSSKYDKPMALIQKRGMRSAMGSAHWITLTNHLSTEDAVKQLKGQGYRIFASDLNPSSKDVRELDWDGPICVVMGNEDRGISQEMRELADETFTLPMCGFAESFNLSVATAITCAHMSASSREKDKGPIQPGDLDEHEVNCLRLKWYMNSLPQRKMGGALLRKAGIKLPKVFDRL